MEKTKKFSLSKKWRPWLILLAVLLVLHLLLGVHIPLFRRGVAVFDGEETMLSGEDAFWIRLSLSSKWIFPDGLRACGFHESVSLNFGEGYTFCFARDDCSGIWWKEKDIYLLISDREYRWLQNKMIENYGFEWPC